MRTWARSPRGWICPHDAAGRAALLNYPPHEGRDSHRAAGADWIARRGVDVAPSQVLVTAGAQHALIAALASQLRPGDTVLVEELTYAGLLEAVRLLGIVPVAVAMDADGLRPDALERLAQINRCAHASRCSRSCTTRPGSRCRRHAAAQSPRSWPGAVCT